jgi:hypothetical protein
MAHKNKICNGGGGGGVVPINLPPGMEVMSPEPRTSESSCSERKLDHQTKGTLQSKGCTQASSEVHGHLSSIDNPLPIDTSTCTLCITVL